MRDGDEEEEGRGGGAGGADPAVDEVRVGSQLRRELAHHIRLALRIPNTHPNRHAARSRISPRSLRGVRHEHGRGFADDVGLGVVEGVADAEAVAAGDGIEGLAKDVTAVVAPRRQAQVLSGVALGQPLKGVEGAQCVVRGLLAALAVGGGGVLHAAKDVSRTLRQPRVVTAAGVMHHPAGQQQPTSTPPLSGTSECGIRSMG